MLNHIITQAEQSAEQPIQSNIVISNIAHQCYPELVLG